MQAMAGKLELNMMFVSIVNVVSVVVVESKVEAL